MPGDIDFLPEIESKLDHPLFGGNNTNGGDPFAPPPQRRTIRATLPSRPGSGTATPVSVTIDQTINGYTMHSDITVEGTPLDDAEYDAVVGIITKAF